MGEYKMQERFVVDGFLFPPHQNATVPVEPRRNSLHDPTTWPLTASLLFDVLVKTGSDVRLIPTALEPSAVGVAVVAKIGAEVLTVIRPFGPLDGNAIECSEKKFLVVRIGAADSQPQRHPATIAKNRTLNAEFAAIGRVFAGFFPRPAVPWWRNRRCFANSNRCDTVGRTASTSAATLDRTLPVRSILENSDGPCCLLRTRTAGPSIGNRCATHSRCRPSPSAGRLAVGRQSETSNTLATAEPRAAKKHPTSANSIPKTPFACASSPCRSQSNAARRLIRMLAVIRF